MADQHPAPTFRERVLAFERGLITDALRTCGGNQTQAARLLRISLRTLVYKLRSFKMRDRDLEQAG